MSNKLKLHLGCGERFLEGYYHIDINNFDHIDHIGPVSDLNMFENGSVFEIYASHVLEYFDKFESLEVLKEWKRVLEPNGILRLAVPNFENLVKVYESTKDIDNIIGPVIGRWEINQNELIYHKQIFDELSLSKQLKEVGFKKVVKWDWKDFISDHIDYDDHSQAYFPHMDKENGLHVSLNLIAVN